LGYSSRESGHKREPEPPERIRGYILGITHFRLWKTGV
jgi:hypothetical protein